MPGAGIGLIQPRLSTEAIGMRVPELALLPDKIPVGTKPPSANVMVRIYEVCATPRLWIPDFAGVSEKVGGRSVFLRPRRAPLCYAPGIKITATNATFPGFPTSQLLVESSGLADCAHRCHGNRPRPRRKSHQ